MSQFVAELMGTFILILLGNGVVANVVLSGTKGNDGGWIVITTGWALAVFTGVVVAGPYSGAHINPAVTLGLAFAGAFDWNLVPEFLLAQLLGAMLGAGMVWLIYRDHYKRTEEAGLKEATFFTAPSISNTFSNFLSELMGTFLLVFVIFYFSEPQLNSASPTPIGLGSLGALPVALLVWAIGLSLGGTTGYAINPVRDLGPRIMYSLLPIRGKSKAHWAYAWIPVLGPVCGAGLAALLYLILQ